MANNVLGAGPQGGMEIPGMNQRAYPQMAAGMGPGAGAEESPQPGMGEEPPDNVAALARLMSIMGIDPSNPTEASKIQGFLMGMGLPSARRIADQKKSRGITDDQTGVHAQPEPPPMPPGVSSTPMPPGPQM